AARVDAIQNVRVVRVGQRPCLVQVRGEPGRGGRGRHVASGKREEGDLLTLVLEVAYVVGVATDVEARGRCIERVRAGAERIAPGGPLQRHAAAWIYGLNAQKR